MITGLHLYFGQLFLIFPTFEEAIFQAKIMKKIKTIKNDNATSFEFIIKYSVKLSFY